MKIAVLAAALLAFTGAGVASACPFSDKQAESTQKPMPTT